VDQVKQWIAEGRANASTLVQPEGGTDWVPLSSLAEFNDALAAHPPPAAAVTPPPPPSDPDDLAAYVRSRDYDLDIGACVSRSWNLLTQHLGLLVGATLIFIVLSFIVAQVLGLFTRPAIRSLMQGNISAGPILMLVLLNIPQMALATVLKSGLIAILLKLIRGQPAGIGDLFSGFGSSFIQLAAAGIVVQLLVLIACLFCLVPGIYLAVAWTLTIPLIIDRGLDFWSAMELSRKVVTQHWWLVFCLVIVAALINLAGVIACCVGILAALPLGIGAIIYAYEDIFRGPGSTAP
jgi:uncharacterized membrane protein